jgi:hypothetical protein
MNFLKQLKNMATDSSSSSGVVQNWYITAERAEGLKDKDTFSKSDPYLKIEFGGKSFRTRTINNDRSPAWNETFHVKLNSSHAKDINLSLKDDDIGFDDTIGIATVSRADLPTYPGEEKSLRVPIYRKEQISGIVHLRVKLIADVQSISQTSNISTYSQQPMSSQSSNSYNPPKQSSNVQSYPPPTYNAPYQQPQQGFNQPQQQFYNQPQSSYYQPQPSYYQPQPPNYQSQHPNYNQYPQQQGPPMTNPSYQSHPQQQTQFNPNYQYERRQ